MELRPLLLPFLFFASSSASFYFDYCPTHGSQQIKTSGDIFKLHDVRQQVKKIHYDKATLPDRSLNKQFLIECIGLKEIVAEDCDLSTINLQVLTKDGTRFQSYKELVLLNLKDNVISRINDGCFDSAIELRMLDLSNNDLTELGQHAWSGLKKLQELDLSSNRLTNLVCSFKHLPMIRKLDLSQNRLTHVNLNSFQDNPNLVSLSVKQNNIKKLSSERELNLTDLDLSSNDLTDISALENAPRIEHLSLSNNQMLVLNRNTFTQWAWKIQSLHVMALRKWTEEGYEILNHLINLKSLSVGGATRVNRLDGLKQLETLTLDEDSDDILDDRVIKAKFPKLQKISREKNVWEQPKQQPPKKKIVERLFEYKRSYQTYEAAQKSEKKTCQNHLLVAYSSLLTAAVVCCAGVYLVMRLRKSSAVPQDGEANKQKNVEN